MIWEQEKEQVRALERQVKALKQACEEERKQKQSLQAKVDHLVSEQGAAGDRLLSASQQADQFQLELRSATEALQKSHKDQSHLEDRCRQLELRASGVDQAQIALQTTQKALDNCQFRLNEQERRVGQLTEERDKTQKTLEVCQSRMKHLEYQVNDLNYQVMQELIKNQNIEKKIEGVPYLEDKIAELEKTVKKRDQELEQKSALLTSSRKTLREYKEKLREQENRFREVEEIRAELDLSRNEVSTLKRLQAGKDVLVFQKSQALDFAKDVLETLQYSAEAEKLERVQELIERSCHVLSCQTPASSRTQSTTRSSPSPDSDQLWTDGIGSTSTNRNGRPWTVTAGFRGSIAAPGYRGHGRHDNKFLERLLTDGDHKDSYLSQSYPRRGQNSAVRPSTSHCAPSREAWSRSSSKRLVYRNETQNKMRYRPSADFACKSEEIECLNLAHSGTFDSSSTNSSANPHIKMADIIARILDEKELHELHISGSTDVFYSALLQLGDRVFVKFPQSHRPQKPVRNSVLQRFGNKKVSKEKNYCGIIKYKGTLGTSSFYVGINLDDPVGDTDGRVGEERFMYTSTEHGKFLRITNVVSVFDVESSRYVDLAALKHALTQRASEK